MKIAGLIFFIIFVLLTLLHLVFCFYEKEFERKITKTFCLGSLTLATVFLIPHYPLVYLGLAFGTIGDLFLIFKHKLLFATGAFSFLLGHVLYFTCLIKEFLINLVPWYFYLIFGTLYLLIIISLLKPISKFSKDKLINIGGSFYFGFQILTFVLSIVSVIYNPNTYLYFVVLGYIFFLVSDSILMYAKFIKPFKRKHFIIMLTYLLAQFFISLGFYLTLGL